MKPSPPNSAPKLWNSCAAGNKVLESWGREKNLLLDRFFPSSPTCPAIATGDGGTPSLFPLSQRSPKGEDGKPFIGIYLFALQKDKCPSSF